MKKAKMKNVKTQRISNSISGNKKSIATQTSNFDNLILEIAKLQEQVKLLQLENDVLRKHMKSPNSDKLDNVVHQKAFNSTPQPIPKINIEISSCGCKGNCSSRCGCVKKNNKCNPSCKCNDKICQNQKLKQNYENKENISRNDVKTFKKQSAKKSEAMKIIMNSEDLFNLDIEDICNDNKKRAKYQHIEERHINIHPSFNMENISIQNLQTNSDCTNIVTSKKKGKEKKQNNDEKPYLIEKGDENAITNDTGVITNIISDESNASKDSTMMFDPMKPRHQLSRTPPHSKKCTDEISLKMNETIQSQSYDESIEKMTVVSPNMQDVAEEEIDWEQHTAQLIPCKKCKRTFMPHRIQKHEACCKRI